MLLRLAAPKPSGVGTALWNADCAKQGNQNLGMCPNDLHFSCTRKISGSTPGKVCTCVLSDWKISQFLKIEKGKWIKWLVPQWRAEPLESPEEVFIKISMTFQILMCLGWGEGRVSMLNKKEPWEGYDHLPYTTLGATLFQNFNTPRKIPKELWFRKFCLFASTHFTKDMLLYILACN